MYYLQQPRHKTTQEHVIACWFKKMCVYMCVCNEILLSHKKDQALTFAATCIDLENIVPTEIREILYDIAYM